MDTFPWLGGPAASSPVNADTGSATTEYILLQIFTTFIASYLADFKT